MPKIQVTNPTEADHSVYFPADNFRIPLSLWGIFSYFPTAKPPVSELDKIDDVYALTPDRWNPHSDVYARNEESMLDWEGNMVEPKHCNRIILADVPDDPILASSLQVSSIEVAAVNEAIDGEGNCDCADCGEMRRVMFDMLSVLGASAVVSDDDVLCAKLDDRAILGHFQAAVGATTVSDQAEQVLESASDRDRSQTSTAECDEGSSDDTDSEDGSWFEETVQKIVTEGLAGDLDLDEVMASAAHARPRTNVDAQHLSKIWRIDVDTAKRTLDVTSQSKRRTANPKLSRNYATGDRMLRYKCIKEFFFMDTFFATGKAGKSTRGHTCCQLFVTDKGFVYVVPMRSRADVLLAVKQFAKEIGAPKALITDPAREQKSQELRKFCNDIGTTLCVLEEGTQWANRAELHIGLIKEAVRKDMKAANCPLPFWDYCVERRARINNLTAKDLFQLHGLNAHTATLGTEGDILSLCQFAFYQWGFYREKSSKFLFGSELLCQVLSPARGEGNEMCQWVLMANGNVLPRCSVRPLTTAEIHSDVEIERCQIFELSNL